MRLPAWAALLAWFAFLAYRIHAPHPPPPADPDATGAAAPSPPTGAAATATAGGAAQQRSADEPAGPARDEIGEQVRAVKIALTGLLLRGDFEGALARIARERRRAPSETFQREMEMLAEFVIEIARTRRVIARSLEDRVGDEIVVRVGSRTHTILPRAMSGNRVNAILIDRKNPTVLTHSATFSLFQLHSQDLCEWLGPADNSAKSAMKFLLFMKDGNRAEAERYARNSGPFSEIFTQYMQSP